MPWLSVLDNVMLGARLRSERPEKTRAFDLLARVGLTANVHDLPTKLSGGMRQRAMIAMALACNPKVLIADEPTTALDVTIQAQVLDLIVDLQSRLNTAVILITHDLGVIAETAHRVIVMYAGRKVEEAQVNRIFQVPLHPYTKGLLASVPRLDASVGADPSVGRTQRLAEIPGVVPSLAAMPSGCEFAPRCYKADDHCRAEVPPFNETDGSDHWVACWHAASAEAS
jgi:peptide/nickel transport system ATP-binding protein